MNASSLQVQVFSLIALVLFSVAMVYAGIRASKSTKTIEGFLIGGRNVGAWFTAFAYGTTYFSAVIFIGYAGKHGWDIGIGSIWIGIGNALLGCFLAWKVLANRTRIMTHNLNSKTMPEFFEARYESKNIKLVSAVIIFVFLVPYSAAVYKGLGSFFNTIFPNVSVNVCMLLIAVLTAVFLFLGGYIASVYTDFIQGIIMIFGVITMVLLITFNQKAGGPVNAFNKLKEYQPTLVSLFGKGNGKFLLTNILLTSFGTWGLPQMVSKFYAVKDKAAIKKATVVSTVFALLIGAGAYYVGCFGRIYLENVKPAAGYDAIIPNLLLTALGDSNVFSTIVLAVILTLLLSASMSTLSAIVLTSSSAISVDLLPFVMPKFTKDMQMYLTRVLCLLFVALSYIFATFNIAIIVSIMSFSWGIVSGSFIGPYIWGLYSKRTTKIAAWCGVVGGFGTVALLTAVETARNGFASASPNAPVYGVTAMAVSFVIVPVVSFFTKKPSDAVVAKAFNGVGR